MAFPLRAIEIKCSEPHVIERIARRLPRGLEIYFEVPMDAESHAALDAIRAAGARAKLRMGGVVPEAIPPSQMLRKCLRTCQTSAAI